MKSAIEQALDKVKNLNVQKLDEPKPEKQKKGEDPISYTYDPRPSLYLGDEELPTIGKYKAGDKVVIVCECYVSSVNTSDRMEDKESKKSLDCNLRIEAIADITKG